MPFKYANMLAVPVDDARGTGANLRLIGDVLLALEEGAPLSVPPVKDMQMRLARFYQTYSKKSCTRKWRFFWFLTTF